MATYQIIRRYFNSQDHDAETIATGLTLRQARKLCSDRETSSRTCREPANVERTRRCGPWFDGYTQE
jgi:hypothetical protein